MTQPVVGRGEDATKWIKCSECLPDTDREVFGWAKGYGITYCARYFRQEHGWDVPWEITHWMERPKEPTE